MKKLFRDIEKSNAAFEKLPKAQKRVVLARDILTQLNSKFLTSSLVYTEIELLNQGTLFTEDAKTVLQTKTKQCKVCAIGAFYIAAILRRNNIMYGNTQYACKLSIIDYLEDEQRLFSKAQLHKIEGAFENWDSSKKWAKDVTDRTDRLKLVMQNVIVNNGVFKQTTPVSKYKGVWKVEGFKK